MKLETLPNDQKKNLCRKYFMAGFALLPFLWAVNTVWFFKEAFCVPQYPEQKQIKKYVILSGLGAILWMAGLVIWMIIFQQYRSSWGAIGDNLSFIIPKGIP